MMRFSQQFIIKTITSNSQQNIEFQLMLPQKQKSRHSASTKLVQQTYSHLSLLISQVWKIKASLQQLLSTSIFRNSNMEEIISSLQCFPKTFERNKNLQNEQAAFQHLTLIIKNLLLSKKQRKFKPYHLWTHWKMGENILIRRIREGLKEDFKDITHNHQNFTLYNFIQQIEYISASIYQWANLKATKNYPQQIQHFKFVHLQSKLASKMISPTACQTAVSSACISRDKSYQQRKQNDLSKDQQNNSKIMSRCTAEPHRQQAKLIARCPSANQVLAQSFKRPIQESRKPIKRIIKKSTGIDARIKKSLTKNTKQNNFIVFHNSRQNQELAIIKNYTSKDQNISILNKSFQRHQKQSDPLLNGQQQRKSQQNSSSLKWINHLNHNQNGQEFQQAQYLAVSNQNNDEIKSSEVARTQQRKRTANYTKKRENHSAFVSDLKRASVQSIKKLSRHYIKYKKGKNSYKSPRKSEKISIASIQSMRNKKYQVAVKKQVANAPPKRRKAIRTEKRLSEIQVLVGQINNESQQKQLKFEDNILIALDDVIKIKKTNQKKQQPQKLQNQLTLQFRYSQLSQFVRNTQFTANLTPTSTFFLQQSNIKNAQDSVMREKFKALTKTQPLTKIFEISCSTKSNKDNIYNQIQRKFSFATDQQWIRQAFDGHTVLQQKNV